MRGGAHDNSGFERIIVAAPAGESALLVCAIPRVAVLDELQIRLWVNASRPDVQVAAHVVLPRSLDVQHRAPATAIIRGSIYNRPGQWQELNIAEVPRLLADQVRVMRAIPGASIDPHEAFIDAVVLIVPGNPNGMELGTDDLQVDGVLLSAEAGAIHPYGMMATAARRRTSANAQSASSMNRGGALNTVDGVASSTKAATVRLDGTTLFVNGKPFLPRVIQWNGETMQFLSGCGFNVVQLPTAPTAEQSTEAAQYGLWFLCPPPHPDEIARGGLGRDGDRVLGWQLQDDALEVDPHYAMRWAELVREKDAVFGRPLVATPQTNWASLSDAADVLIAQNPRIGLLSPTEIQSWFASCPQKAKPGTPLWIRLSTQSNEDVRQQVHALTHAGGPFPSVDVQRLESSVQVACANGARGFVFQSASLLSDTDEQTRQRATILQLINRQLQLLEPWLASGKVVERVTSSDGTRTGIVLSVDRARLLIPVPNENGSIVNGPRSPARSTANEITFTVAGVPETSQMFFLSPAVIRILSSQRVAGGTRVKQPGGGEGFILITEDPQVIQSLRQRIAHDGAATVQLERDLAARQARQMASTCQRLAQLGYNSDLAMRIAATVNQQVPQMDSLLAGGQVEQAHDLAVSAGQQLERADDEQRQAVESRGLFDSNPLAVSCDTLPELGALQRSYTSLRPGDNLLEGGDFEGLDQMTQAGWQNVASPAASNRSSAQLSAVEPRHGSYCLELSATDASASERQRHGDGSIWIVSPPMPVDQNQIIEISGWARIDRPFADGDGLEIVDSLGGPALSLVVGRTSGWQPFRMIRAASKPSKLRITFALAGFGSAKIDAVMVRALGQPIARRLPPAPSGEAFTATIAPGMTRPGFAAPSTR